MQKFTNKGATTGNYTIRRSFAAGDGLPFWYSVLAYNAANDPSYESSDNYVGGKFSRANLHLWTADGTEFIQATSGNGRESSHVTTFGWIWVPSETGDHAFSPPLPTYSNGVRTEAPDVVKNASFFENVVVANDASSSENAVVQAGGTVRMNATQDLSNSVVREGITLGRR